MIQRPQPYVGRFNGRSPMSADSCRHQQSQRRKSVVRDSGSEEVVEELRKVTKERVKVTKEDVRKSSSNA